MNRRQLIAAALLLGLAVACGPKAPAPFGAGPPPAQVAWQQMETNMFFHFGPHTLTGAEWGDGTET